MIFRRKNYLNFDDLVSCQDCKCLLLKWHAQEIKVGGINLWIYYCQAHKKPYNRVLWDEGDRYFAEVEVDRNGKPVKRSKKPPKKQKK